MNKSKPRIDVAVAVVFNSQGQVLWACRPQGKPYAGYWEFPGGKVEPNETVWQALVRELKEELDITAIEGGPWFQVEHDYVHADVRLHLYRVWAFEGAPKPLEQQRFTWANLGKPELSPVLPATEPLLPKLAQPKAMAITAYGSAFEAFASRFEENLSKVSQSMYVQFREKEQLGDALLRAFWHCHALCLKTGHTLLINSDTWLNLQGHFNGLPSPLHLTEAHLLAGKFSDLPCAGASVHGESGLQAAFVRGLQYAVLGAVRKTPSHPGQPGMGWFEFQQIAKKARLPVFAIGGLAWDELTVAQSNGAHGLAMCSQFSI